MNNEEPIGKGCHFMRERESHRICFYTLSGCPYDDGNIIRNCPMYQAIKENHKALEIEVEE